VGKSDMNIDWERTLREPIRIKGNSENMGALIWRVCQPKREVGEMECW
jgi:hypothetical protein